jgi:hypothetical protein
MPARAQFCDKMAVCLESKGNKKSRQTNPFLAKREIPVELNPVSAFVKPISSLRLGSPINITDYLTVFNYTKGVIQEVSSLD